MAITYDARTGTLTSTGSYSVDLTVGNITLNTANNIDFEDTGVNIGRWNASTFYTATNSSIHYAPGLADYVTNSWSSGNYFTTFSGSPTWQINGTAGITISDPVTFHTPSATNTSINLPHGVAPTTPTDGDVWTTTTGLFVQANGTTIGPVVDAATAPPAPSALLVGKWTYDGTSTSMTNPGSGFIRFNNATPTSANIMSIHYIDNDAVDWEQHILDAWGGTATGILVRMTKVGDPLTYMVWSINSDNDQLTYNLPYINVVAWEGTWTNGDEIYIEIQTQPFVQRPTTDHGIYTASATLSGQPLNGLIQSSIITHDPAGGSAQFNFLDGGTGVISYNAGNFDISGGAINQIRSSNRFELYGSTNSLPRLTVTETSVQLGHANDVGNGTPMLYLHERTSADAGVAEFGQLWVKDDAPNNLYFRDDAGTDYNLTNPGSTATTISTGWSTGSGGGSFTIGANAPLLLTEQANDDTPGAGLGQVWVQTDTPNRLMFTDDTGQDIRVTPYRATVQTTNATQTEIISIAVASGTTFGYRINIVGNEAATGDTVFESIFGAIHNQGGTTAIVGSDIVDRTEDAGAAAWVVTVAADDTTDALTVDVTGEASHTIDWKVSVEILDV